jgi:hypothetical protein
LLYFLLLVMVKRTLQQQWSGVERALQQQRSVRACSNSERSARCSNSEACAAAVAKRAKRAL